MEQKVFADRFPWKLLNWRSPEAQRAWLAKRLPKRGADLHFPMDGTVLKNRWVILSESGEGWPSVGNVLNAWPGTTTLFAPPALSSAVHFGCAFRVVRPGEFAVGSPLFDDLLVRSVENPPGLVLLLDRNPSPQMLYLVAKTEAPVRISFGENSFFPWCNFNIAAGNPAQWPSLLAKWMTPAPEGSRRPKR